MNDIPFYKTRMGQRFYEKTLQELAQQIQRLNDILERLLLGDENEAITPLVVAMAVE